MLECLELHDDDEIEGFLRTDPDVHLYGLGDLDPFFRPHTRWFAAKDSSKGVRAVFFLYTASSLPVLIALDEKDPDAANALLAWLSPTIDVPIYCHVSPSIHKTFSTQFHPESHSLHLRLRLADRTRLTAASLGAGFSMRRFLDGDLATLATFYDEAYPGHWFEGYMLKQGLYLGVFDQYGTLACVAGTHIASPRYRLAAIGNVATLPAFRGQGLATAATAAVCRALGDDAQHIGLNVNASNLAALRCYERIGFERVMEFEEMMVSKRRDPSS